MTARWLTAAEVAVLAGAHVPRRAHCGYCLDPWPCDTAALLAQDGAWRALVGELLAAYQAWLLAGVAGMDAGAALPARGLPRWQAALQAAQAALGGEGG
ncbi:MAG TPA: hypothetical protein VN524_18455 [Hyphomicrobiaceae bacterium]|nr:hypothetical protein [Hyphomicrobiaceae bacterium]